MPELSFYPVAIVTFILGTLLSDFHFYILLLGILSTGPNITLVLPWSIAAYSNLDTAYTFTSVLALVVVLGSVFHLDIRLDTYTSISRHDSALLMDILHVYDSVILMDISLEWYPFPDIANSLDCIFSLKVIKLFWAPHLVYGHR